MDKNINTSASENQKEHKYCGIIMSMNHTQEYTEEHLSEVSSILHEAATQAGFIPNIITFDESIGIIPKRIIQDLYENQVVICDISNKSPSMMFELGMRLAFDKPTIIVKDDRTPYPFDVYSAEYLEYPSHLRYKDVNNFKQALQQKIKELYSQFQKNNDYSAFLKYFGPLEAANLEKKESNIFERLFNEISDLKKVVSGLQAPTVDKVSKTKSSFEKNTSKEKAEEVITSQEDNSFSDIYSGLIESGDEGEVVIDNTLSMFAERDTTVKTANE